MGGICVLATFDGSAVDSHALGAMLQAASHRGPDGTGVWKDDGVVIGHQRAHLLPEDRHVQQPLARHGLVVVADARIDNRDELVPLLSRRGLLADLPGVPDAEVILAAYRLWGPSCSSRLVGDFAFAIWERRARTLFATRDPMGMRPLFLWSEPRSRVLLASEIKQLLAAPGVPRRIHEAAIAASLAGPYMPTSWTVYEGIEQLPPGHAMTMDEQGRRGWRAWAPDPGRHFGARDAAAAQEAFKDALERAVQDRLRSTRPVGIFLSGGMDSGSVASLAGGLVERGAVSSSVRTYSHAFHELVDSDERAVSDVIAARYRLPVTPVLADDVWPLAGYPAHGPDEDDPYVWVYQALVEHMLARCREDEVGVVIVADRGDEVTGDWVFDELGMLRAGRVSDSLTDLRAAAGSPRAAWPNLKRSILWPAFSAHWPSMATRRAARRGDPWPSWIPKSFAADTDLGDIITEATKPSPFDGTARTLRHQRIFSPQAVRVAALRERTRAQRGMGFADPFADRRLVELVLSMPQWLVQRRTQPKALARAAMAGVMPEPARRAARKTIPESLFDRGFKDRAVPVVEQLMTTSLAGRRGWLDEDEVRRVHQRYVLSGDADADFWWPLTVEMWLRRWWA